jgi:hypothetical protein
MSRRESRGTRRIASVVATPKARRSGSKSAKRIPRKKDGPEVGNEAGGQDQLAELAAGQT